MPVAYQLARLARAALTVLLLSSVLTPHAHADAGDFQAMPGLWKIVTHSSAKGAPHETVAWHCVDEDADPWASFASLAPTDGASCARSDEHRSRTSLDWSLRCTAPATLHGRVAFDSPEHYSATLGAEGTEPLLRVEGKRYAACTSPKD
ncbi:DUF3617 domain-containing protein [Dyella sp. 2RAB6]|uniref:DUF3617 domain-containing protein n=1 Tax=Dyella sp. 2RAB6 TaxID=3232992 RepID=UPI003F8FEA32